MTLLYDMHKNISRRLGDKIGRTCAPLADLGISHFYHYMLTDSGGFASAGWNQEWHECLFTGPDCYLALPYFREVENGGSIIFTQAVENKHWKNLAKTAKDEFQINLGLQVCISTDDGQEAFGFGLNTDDPIKHMKLLNQLPLIQKFLKSYRKDFKNDFLKDNLVDAASLVGPSFYESLKQECVSHKAYLEAPAPFTKRENEVVGLILNGFPASKIAEKLFISTRTVEHHVERIKNKLDCDSKSDLIGKLRELELFGFRF